MTYHCFPTSKPHLTVLSLSNNVQSRQSKGNHLKVFQTLKSLDPDQKRVIYAYLCTLAIGSLASILSFGFGATLVFFLSPWCKIFFASLNTSEEMKPSHYQFANGRILPISDYLGYFKRLYILTPTLILALFLLMAFCLDYDFFGFTAFLLVLSYHTVLSAYLVQHKLPLLSAKFNQHQTSAFDNLPELNFRFMEDDEPSRFSCNPKYSNLPGNIFNDDYRPKSHF